MMDELKEITPEYVYVTIPANYICIYHKILVLLAEYGISMLKDCSAKCTPRNKTIIDCFNMFNAAVAARKLGQDKVAETIIKYVDGQLKLIYKNEIDTNIVFPVDEHGHLKAIISCNGDNPKFYIDPDSGELVENATDESNNVEFGLDETDLNAE